MKRYLIGIFLISSLSIRASDIESIQVMSIDSAISDARKKNDINAIRRILNDAKTLRATIKNPSEQKKLDSSIKSLEVFLASYKQGAKPAGQPTFSEQQQLDRLRFDSIKEAFDATQNLEAKQQIAKDAQKQLDELKSLESWEKDSLLQYMKDELNRLQKSKARRPEKVIQPEYMQQQQPKRLSQEDLRKKEQTIIGDLQQRFSSAKMQNNFEEMEKVYQELQNQLPKLSTVEKEDRILIPFDMKRAIEQAKENLEFRKYGAEGVPAKTPSLSRESSAEFDERMRRVRGIENLPSQEQTEQKITSEQEPKKEEAAGPIGFGYFEVPSYYPLALREKYDLQKNFDNPETAFWKALAEIYYKYPSRLNSRVSDKDYAKELIEWIVSLDPEKIAKKSDEQFNYNARPHVLAINKYTYDKGVQIAKAYFYAALARNIYDAYNWLKNNKLFVADDEETVKNSMENYMRIAKNTYPAGSFWWQKSGYLF